MAITKKPYRKWKNAYEITSGAVKMHVVAGIGPRVLSLRLGQGPNLLFDDVDEKAGFEDWKIYGGHRFWVGPESQMTYAPDNGPCQARVANKSLVLECAVDPHTALQKTLIITPAPKGFRLYHLLRNTGAFLAPPSAVWALTCVRPTGVCAFPWRTGPSGWNLASVQYWAAWGGHATDLESPQWRPTRDLYEIHPTGEEGKAGSRVEPATEDSSLGWIGQWTSDATFIKAFHVQSESGYPDNNCNVEIYTCSKFIELETLSPMATLAPGESLVQYERWFVVKPIERSTAAVAGLIGQD